MEKDEHSGAPRRVDPRESLYLSAALTGDEGVPRGNARIRNLSASGMKADCDRPFEEGERLKIDFRGVGEVDGQVVWAQGNSIGIKFDAPIDPKLARKPVAAAPPPPPPPPKRYKI